MLYRELLPEDCPPEQASEITAPRLVYRLVRHNPPIDDDFRSQRAENPALTLHNVSECQARGLSVFADRSGAMRRSRIGKLQGTMICEVTLTQGAGRMLRTGNQGHYTWWPWAGYDILANCRMAAL